MVRRCKTPKHKHGNLSLKNAARSTSGPCLACAEPVLCQAHVEHEWSLAHAEHEWSQALAEHEWSLARAGPVLRQAPAEHEWSLAREGSVLCQARVEYEWWASPGGTSVRTPAHLPALETSGVELGTACHVCSFLSGKLHADLIWLLALSSYHLRIMAKLHPALGQTLETSSAKGLRDSEVTLRHPIRAPSTGLEI